MTRKHLSSITLLILAALGVVACLVIAAPFLAALTWALSLAIVANPLHLWIARRVRRPDLAAGLSVAIVALGLLVPAGVVGHQIAREATQRFDTFQEMVASGALEANLKQDPKLSGLTYWVQNNVNVEEEFRNILRGVQQQLGQWVQGSVWAVLQLLVALFVLFFLFRDQERSIQALRWMMPLSDKEADEVLERVRGMVHATIYGNVVVAGVQGTLGGLMFWMLGIPAALLWGVVMALLSLVPTLGAFVVWLPAAAVMAVQGDWIKAAILAGWGTMVVGSIDNLLLPLIVGKQIRMHTVPVFIATVGGLIIFGAAGLVLGPVAFAFTLALLEILRRRTAGSRSAEQPT